MERAGGREGEKERKKERGRGKERERENEKERERTREREGESVWVCARLCVCARGDSKGMSRAQGAGSREQGAGSRVAVVRAHVARGGGGVVGTLWCGGLVSSAGRWRRQRHAACCARRSEIGHLAMTPLPLFSAKISMSLDKRQYTWHTRLMLHRRIMSANAPTTSGADCKTYIHRADLDVIWM